MRPEAAALAAALVAVAARAGDVPLAGLEWIGAAELPAGLTFAGEPVGGLSGIVWDDAAGELLALSDDRSERAPARFYRLGLDLADGRLDSGDVTVRSVFHLAGARGRLFAEKSLDPEGIALAAGRLFLSSEGDAPRGQAAFVAEADLRGRVRRHLELPARYLPAGSGEAERGIRFNLGFESLAATADGRYLFAASENALAQDGPAADFGVPSVARILRWPLERPGAPREWAYRVEGVRGREASPTAFRVNGLVDLLPLGEETLVALERSFTDGGRNEIRLYRVSLAGATDVSSLDGLDPRPELTVAAKELLVDFDDLGIPLDNFEGLAFGPRLPDGRRTLLAVSDDNFNPWQKTLFLAFALDERRATVAAVQGAGHRSPFEGRWVVDLEGSVAATVDTRNERGFWLESEAPDGNPATSEGIFVEWEGGATLTRGDRVAVHGRVEERAATERQLPVTRLRLDALVPRGRAELPPPPRLFRDLHPPAALDDDRDGLARFEPERDALDFWESLEGMRVEVGAGTVVGPTRSFGELVLLPDGVETGPRTAAGGVRLEPAGPPPGRVAISGRLAGGMPDAAVGARIPHPVEGIVDYGFGAYRLLAVARPEVLAAPGGRCAPGGERTRLRAEPERPTLAVFNVENLSVAGPPERFERVARIVVDTLGAPVLVGLEEIQDDSGEADDGVVSASRTVEALARAIAAAGGPRYEAAWIDPEDRREGGVPGGNIRVALLFDPLRARLPRRGDPGPLDGAAVALERGVPVLRPNPGRVAPSSSAFSLATGEGVRRSLAVELELSGAPFYVVLNHWSSKFEDDRDYGGRQPPRKPTAALRLAQAREVRAWVDGLLALDPSARIVVAGDLNDFEWTPALAAIAAPPLVSLIQRIAEPDRYTYNFEGVSQVLDHVVVSPALAPGAEIDLLHVDSDCPDAARASDHDPTVVRFDLRRRARAR
jgi:hypothetical protein